MAAATIWMVAPAASARACGKSDFGIKERSVWPGSDQHAPSNSRLVVSYNVVSAPEMEQEIPPVGADVRLLDGDGTLVLSSFEVVGSSKVVIHPADSLLPNHVYQIADRRNVPCRPHEECKLTAELRAFVSFTTGESIDTDPPAFEGLKSIAVGERQTCDNTACCGPYDQFPVRLAWSAASDQTAGDDLRYNVYRRADDSLSLILVAGLVTGIELQGQRACSRSAAFPSSHDLLAGSYVVRAVDWAGNEDGNSVTHDLDEVCCDGACGAAEPVIACAVAGPPGSPTRGPWPVVGFLSAMLLGACAVVARKARTPRHRK